LTPKTDAWLLRDDLIDAERAFVRRVGAPRSKRTNSIADVGGGHERMRVLSGMLLPPLLPAKTSERGDQADDQ